MKRLQIIGAIFTSIFLVGNCGISHAAETYQQNPRGSQQQEGQSFVQQTIQNIVDVIRYLSAKESAPPNPIEQKFCAKPAEVTSIDLGPYTKHEINQFFARNTLEQFPNLQSFIACGCVITPQTIRQLRFPNSLQRVSLPHSFIGYDEVVTLQFPSNLKFLNLEGNNLTNLAAWELAQKLPAGIQVLNLERQQTTTPVDDLGFEWICDKHPAIRIKTSSGFLSYWTDKAHLDNVRARYGEDSAGI